MHVPKKYFHDKIILLFLSLNTFATVASSLLLLLRINFGDVYVIQYRDRVGRISAFENDNASALLMFIVFSLGVLLFHGFISMRMYHHRKHYSMLVLALGLLLIVISGIVANALIGTS